MLKTRVFTALALLPPLLLAIAYLPDEGPVTIDTSAFDHNLELRWRDPASAEDVPGGTIPNDGINRLTPPRSGDWIMILERVRP